MFRQKGYISTLLLALFIIAMGCRFSSAIACECNSQPQQHICCSCTQHTADCSTHTSQFDSRCTLNIADNGEAIFIFESSSKRNIDDAKRSLLYVVDITHQHLSEIQSYTHQLYALSLQDYTSQYYLRSCSLRAPPHLA